MGVIYKNGISYGGGGGGSTPSEGDYGIVQNSSYLPSGLGSDDRKMYWSIDDEYFYLWNGTEWVAQEPDGVNELTEQQVDDLIDLIN